MQSLSLLSVMGAALLTTALPSVAQTVQDPSAQCSKDLATQPQFSELRGKIPLADSRDITFAMLANDALPTKPERDAIAAWFSGLEQCKSVGESFRQANYPPEVNDQLIASITALNEIGVDLYKGRISFGEADKRIANVRDQLTAKVTEIVQQYKKEIEAQRTQAAALKAQAENQRLQAATQAQQAASQDEELRLRRNQMIMNYLQANKVQIAPLPQPQYRSPVITNCSQNGNQTNCFSR